MKLSVGTNWDPAYVDSITKFPEVYEVYGSSNASPVGSGRPAFLLGKVTQEDMPRFIKALHEKGLKFNYTLNAPCLNNLEFNAEHHKKLIEQLEWLAETGIDGVTVSIPYLLEIVKKRFPKLLVKVSIIAHVNSVPKARFFENLGADEIMLDYMINRDFTLLENIRKSVKSKLSLLVNDSCLYGCPYRLYHYNICGHASQANHPTEGFYIDYCAIRCTIERLRDPKLFISSRWIRPEDIRIYEDIGYENFKISGRRMSTKWIANAVQAYSSRSYDGNLASILDFSIPGIEEEAHSIEFETIMKGAVQLKTDSLLGLSQSRPYRPYIDNKSLNGFLNSFRKKGCLGICNECNHCQKYAKKAVKINQPEAAQQLRLYEGLLEDLTTSKIFIGSDNVPQGDEKECSTEMIWPDQLKQNFESIISSAPEAFRTMARSMITKAANENAKKRGATEITEEDMVKAFLKGTPIFFKNNMLKSLKELGIDVNKYST